MDHSNHQMSSTGMDMPMPGHDHDDMPAMCSMNMLFTWDWNNLCVVFRWWHVQTVPGLVGTLIAIVLLGMGYEFLRYVSIKLDIGSYNLELPQHSEDSILANPHEQNEDSDSAAVSGGLYALRFKKLLSLNTNTKKSLFYAFQVGYSFFLMLIFMTYNGWAMLAIVIGAFLGHKLWGSSAARGMACH